MANRCNDWQELLKLANKDLEKCGTALHVTKDDVDGTFSLTIHFSKVNAKGKEIWFMNDHFAENYYEDEMSALINDAWVHAKVKAKEVFHLKKQPKIKPDKYVKAIVAFGITPSHRASDNDWKELADYYNQDGSALGIRKFKTAAERNAYIMGMNDSLGWEDVYVLDSKEIKALSKHIDLSKLSAPTEC